MGLDQWITRRSQKNHPSTREEVGYWRKANHIHRWFVENVQNNDDDCGCYPVSREQLDSLLRTCRRVLDFRHLAEDQLPRQSGFFYGNTLYDEYYYADIERTIEIIERCLSEPDDVVIEYQSSW